MPNYIEINNFSGLGKMGISRTVLETIASKTVSTIEGASLSKKESLLFQIVKPTKATVSKDGLADIKVAVNIKSGSKVQDVCIQLQEAITNAVKIMCDTIPVSVTISVESVG